MRLILVNAVYFKGQWACRFDKSLTRQAPFYCGARDSMMVAMMVRKASFNYMADRTVKVVEMPYKGSELSLLVIIPEHNDGLRSVESKLTLSQLRSWCAQLQKTEIKLSVPVFSVSSEFELGKTLSGMGMSEAFTDRADFSGMSADKNLYIREVVQKAQIRVDEEGSEAVAATAVLIRAYGIVEDIEVTANHPFLFIIRDNQSGAILFMGRMINPHK